MKKTITLGFLMLLLSAHLFSQTTYTWTGATNNSFSVATNWNPSTGTPGSGDDAVFNSGSTACNITAPITIRSFSVLAGYTGVIDMGSDYHLLTGNLVINSGTVIGTSNTMEIDINSGTGNFILGAGTYSDNGGSVDLYCNAGITFNFTGNIVLNALNFSFIGGTTTARTINFGTNLSVNDVALSGVGARIYNYQGTIHIKNSLNLGNSSHNSINVANNGTFIFDGSSASITGTSAGAGRSYLPNVEINTTGNYDMNQSINVLGNWTANQGTLTLGTSTVNIHGTAANISGTVAAFDNLFIRSGATVNFPASEVLIGAVLTRSGTVNFQPTSSLGFNGNGSQTISGSSFTIAGIRAYTGGGSRNVTVSTPVVILDQLQVDAGVTFAAGGNVTLRSTSAQTARVAESAGTITGNVIVETLIPGGSTGWANLGIRGVTGETVADWDTYVSSGGTTGIPMTCVGCVYSPTVLSTPFVSIQGWDEPTDSYTDLISSTALTPGVGYWVYVGNGATSTTDLRLINTGPLVQGNLSVPVTASGAGDGLGFFYNLVANPYPSPISIDDLFANGNNAFNFSTVAYVFDANLAGGAGAYGSYVGGVSTGNQTGVLPGGQGFYVEFSSFGGTTLDFEESMKVSSTDPLLKPSTTDKGKVVRLKLQGTYDSDDMAFRIHPEATNSFDRKLDAHKIFQTPGYVGYPGPYTKYTTISSKDADDDDYSIHSIPPLTQSVSIPVLVRVSTTGSYTISATDFQDLDASVCVTLHDKLNNTMHNIKQSAYVFTIEDTTSTPRFELLLCRDESLNTVGIAENKAEQSNVLISRDADGAFVKTEFPQTTRAFISAYNLMGQKLMEDIELNTTISNTRLPLHTQNEMVIIRVTTDKTIHSKKVVIH